MSNQHGPWGSQQPGWANQPTPSPAHGWSNQPPSGYPPGYAQPGPPQPPRKDHTVRNVLIGLAVLLLSLIGGCWVSMGVAVQVAADGIRDTIASESANNPPEEVAEGAAFRHDDFKVAEGWKVVRARKGGHVEIRHGRVTNDGAAGRGAGFTFSFYRGKQNLADVECVTNEMQAGDWSRLTCASLNTPFPTGYETIRVADTF